MITEEEKALIVEAQQVYNTIINLKKDPNTSRADLEDYKIAHLGQLWKRFEHFPYKTEKFAYFKLMIDRNLSELERPKTGRIHRLKTLPEYFQDLWEGKKNFECRIDDRHYAVGDQLHLVEYHKEDLYTGRAITVNVKYILKDFIGLQQGYVIMSIEPIEWIDPN